ncbi:MAG: hypothetical protein JXA17_03255 [Dehalococcoidales bacterium]|nr:hypothetical protein [Dehalococcoidales bacterium]
MPTKPFEKLLYRELRKVEAKKIIDIASPLLSEEINYATWIFMRCQDSMKGTAPDEALPILVSYYHVIEMTDGIEVLFSQSCAVPAIPLLRSAFEALLTIEYILKENSQRRAFSWLVCYTHNRIKLYELFDISTQKGREFKAALTSSGLDKYTDFQAIPNIKKSIENLKSLLGSPGYKIAEDEYQEYKTRKKTINWYNLFNGPNDLRSLSKYLNRLPEYDLLYRGWSNIAHAVDLSHFLSRTKSGSPSFRPLRNHEELAQVAKMASIFIIDATKQMINKYRHGENKNFGTWYLKEVRQSYLSL